MHWFLEAFLHAKLLKVQLQRIQNWFDGNEHVHCKVQRAGAEAQELQM